MKKFSHRLLLVLQAVILMAFLDACSKFNDEVAPRDANRSTRGGRLNNNNLCGEGYIWDGFNCVLDPNYYPPDPRPCVSLEDIKNNERNKLVASNGEQAGQQFDQAYNDPNSPYSIVSQYSPTMASYLARVTNAITAGSKDYANTFSGCDYCTAEYSPFTQIQYINSALGPVKSDIQADRSLTEDEKYALLTAIQFSTDKVEGYLDYISDREDCYPDPAWYNQSSTGTLGPVAVNPGDAQTNGFFKKFIKVIKKIVNIVATVVVSTFEYAFKEMIPVLLKKGSKLDLFIAGLTGAVTGIVKGFQRVLTGDYVCILPPCN